MATATASEVKAAVETQDVTLKTSRSKQALDKISHVLNSPENDDLQESQATPIIDQLLSEIYFRWNSTPGGFDSDIFTECSSPTDAKPGRSDSACDYSAANRRNSLLDINFTRSELWAKDVDELQEIYQSVRHDAALMSGKLIRQLKQRDRLITRLQKQNDLITAILHAASMKRSEDARMKFTLNPLPGDDCFEQWRDAMKAVARLPLGIPAHFRKKVWQTLADNHIRSLKLDWHVMVKFCFNERSNPDDNKLGLQIVKDLHRTGCSGFNGTDNEEERALLKRVLLAYARWNKVVGYCQGFNVLAALILDVMDKREADALKVMIFLVDHVLPNGYFANNLRALTVDMAVFRELLRIHLPKLSTHLDRLQSVASRHSKSDVSYEPPLTNVFTMHWFLTLFATCLPKENVLRVWDAVMLDGAEILLRTGVVLWECLAPRISTLQNADQFYGKMGELSQEMMETNLIDPDTLISKIYDLGPFPLPNLSELRERYTYNIAPLLSTNVLSNQPQTNAARKQPQRNGQYRQVPGRSKHQQGGLFSSSDDELDDDEMPTAIGCFSGIFGATLAQQQSIQASAYHNAPEDISVMGPGAYSPSDHNLSRQQGRMPTAISERASTDIVALKKQYKKLIQRHRQAHIILAAASNHHYNKRSEKGRIVPKIETQEVINHLFLSKNGLDKKKNRKTTAGPRIACNFTAGADRGAQNSPRTGIKVNVSVPFTQPTTTTHQVNDRGAGKVPVKKLAVIAAEHQQEQSAEKTESNAVSGYDLNNSDGHCGRSAEQDTSDTSICSNESTNSSISESSLCTNGDFDDSSTTLSAGTEEERLSIRSPSVCSLEESGSANGNSGSSKRRLRTASQSSQCESIAEGFKESEDIEKSPTSNATKKDASRLIKLDIEEPSDSVNSPSQKLDKFEEIEELLLEELDNELRDLQSSKDSGNFSLSATENGFDDVDLFADDPPAPNTTMDKNNTKMSSPKHISIPSQKAEIQADTTSHNSEQCSNTNTIISGAAMCANPTLLKLDSAEQNNNVGPVSEDKSKVNSKPDSERNVPSGVPSIPTKEKKRLSADAIRRKRLDKVISRQYMRDVNSGKRFGYL